MKKRTLFVYKFDQLEQDVNNEQNEPSFALAKGTIIGAVILISTLCKVYAR